MPTPYTQVVDCSSGLKGPAAFYFKEQVMSKATKVIRAGPVVGKSSSLTAWRGAYFYSPMTRLVSHATEYMPTVSGMAGTSA